MNSSLRRCLLVGLTAGVAVSALASWHQLTKRIDTSPIRDALSPASTPDVEKANFVVRDISREALSDTLARPLFNIGRRPVSETVQANGSDEVNRGESSSNALKLVGIMRWGKTHRALIRVSSEPFARWIEVGRTVEGWTLKAIERDFVVVEHENRSITLPILVKAESAAASDTN